MTGLRLKARTLAALGVSNVLHVALYRIGLRSGLHRARRLRSTIPGGPFLAAPEGPPVKASQNGNWIDQALLFGHLSVPARRPAWTSNPIIGEPWPRASAPWWMIPDFDPVAGDIKLVWEPSRMEWLLSLAQQARNGETVALARLNEWLSDWCAANPPYRGPNWKCAQEASIRLMRLAAAALILGNERVALPGTLQFVRTHLQRIDATVSYARAQDNNHGTSEACALFIGGSWLASAGEVHGARIARKGRAMLEERTSRLVGKNGTFSQYSLNYHRVLLDTLCLAEAWRRRMSEPPFGSELVARAAAASHWAFCLVDSRTGEGPNVGANDGAYLLPLSSAPARDFRPSIQAAHALFRQARAYDDVAHDAILLWLGIKPAAGNAEHPETLNASDGGFAMLRKNEAMALIRYPAFRFRPSHADCLHVDLWVGSDNVLRDAGTFSYFAGGLETYFSGTASHNTIQFDERDQMPRLGRFLFGEWLQGAEHAALVENAESCEVASGYVDAWGAAHHRRVRLGTTSLDVQDRFSGFHRKAVLRWRLDPARQWRVTRENGRVRLVGDGIDAVIQATARIASSEIVQGWESRHYLQKTPVPVLEIEFTEPGDVTSRFEWSAS